MDFKLLHQLLAHSERSGAHPKHEASAGQLRSSDVLAVTLEARAESELFGIVNFLHSQPTTQVEDAYLKSEAGNSHATMLLKEEDSDVFKRWVLPKLETM